MTEERGDPAVVRVNYSAIVVAVVVVFIVSSLWYSPLLFGKQFMELSCVAPSTSPNIGKIAGELIRTFILAYVLARLVMLLEVINWKNTVGLGILLWIGFPVILLSGSVMWQNVPWQLAAIHAGDWLQKLLIIAIILGAWSKDGRAGIPTH